jgi:hypothetical protein
VSTPRRPAEHERARLAFAVADALSAEDHRRLLDILAREAEREAPLLDKMAREAEAGRTAVADLLARTAEDDAALLDLLVPDWSTPGPR